MLLGIVVVCVSSTPVAAVAVAPVPGQTEPQAKADFWIIPRMLLLAVGFLMFSPSDR